MFSLYLGSVGETGSRSAGLGARQRPAPRDACLTLAKLRRLQPPPTKLCTAEILGQGLPLVSLLCLEHPAALISGGL